MKEQTQTTALVHPSVPAAPSVSLYIARLMSPREVNKATASYPEFVRERVEGEWMLCGDVAEPMFERFLKERDRLLPVRLTAYHTPAGGAYAAVTHQLGHFQHRFLVPLYEPSVAECLAAMGRDELVFLLGKNGETAAAVLNSPLTANEWLPLRTKTRALAPVAVRAVVCEFRTVASAMMDALQIPSLHQGETVQHVSLSVLMPEVVITSLCKGGEKAGA